MKVSSQEIYNENMALIQRTFGNDKLMLSLRKVAKFLGCDPRTLKCDKNFPTRRVGKRLMVRRESLAEWMSKTSKK